MDQISELRLQTSIWSFVNPWLPRDEHMPPESVPYYPTVPRLVVSVESEAPHVVSLPTEPLSLPKLEWLVLKGTSVEYGFVYVDARDVVAFANRLTTNPLILELCGAIVPQSSYDILRSRFQEVHMNHPWM
ncbi:hypothetical protein BKA62DRAFT_739106 [Auriculariales sp. MPI-PUGE-AT-0066]|nr:hypothetical protein BKA62DRAFT_739106 [Auriculariales sp. MPI-PUGE-AT-0066]